MLRSRRFVLDGKPVLLSRSWLPAAIAARTAIARPDTGLGGTDARLTDLGYADRLDIKPGTPVVDIIRLAVNADGTSVELNA